MKIPVLGNTWFAITLLVLIFLYSSVGSAVPPIRQGALADWVGWEALRFEMSEMEWFCSPVFVVMVSLFCLSMVVATIQRIPLDRTRLGEWTVHLGILVMVLGCFLYFGRKIEGDAVIFRRAALVSAPGMATPAKMAVRPGASVSVAAGGERYHVSVARIVPRYEIPSGPDQGKQTMAVWFAVQSQGPAGSKRFTRVLLAGYPSLTEDVEGRSPAAGLSGRGLLDTHLQIGLDYEPQDTFFLDRTAALYARFEGDADWVEMPIRKLPRYYEHVSSSDDLWPSDDERLPARPIRIEAAPVQAVSGGEASMKGLTFRAVGYLPYAQLESRYMPGGEELNPVVRFSLADGRSRHTYEMAAFDPAGSHMDFSESRTRLEFRWAASAEDRERLSAKHRPRLEFRVAGKDALVEVPLGALLDKGPQPVPGTDYKVTVRPLDVMLNFPLMSEASRGRTDDVVVVSVERGEKKFRRLVFAHNPDQSRDLGEMHTPTTSPADPGLQIRFVDPAPAGILLIGGPTEQDCEIVINNLDGEQMRRSIPVGRPTSQPESAVPLTVDALISKAVQVTRPTLVPRRQRQPLQSVGAAMSLLAVEVDDGTRRQQVWLPFNQYAFPDSTYAYAERFRYGSYLPRTVETSDGRAIELMYSRERRYLPAAIALERFVLETHPGGQRERDFISMIRFYEKDGWSPIREVRSNHPAQYAGLWFFQSEWDPKNEAITVLGVGNREGIGVMLGGVVLSILGMIYSFYIKPIVVRQRMLRDAALLDSEAADASPARATASASPTKRGRTSSHMGLIAFVLSILAAGGSARAETSSFARDVDLSRIRLIAVQNDGRFKPFDTLAREVVQQITGTSFFDGQDPVFTYIDLMLNPTAYADRNLMLVKKARVREVLIKAAGADLSEAAAADVRRTRRVSPQMLRLPAVQQAIEALESDTMNTGRDADLIQTADAYADPRNLRGFLLVAPPPGGTSASRWLGIDAITGGPNAANAVDAALGAELASNWKQLDTAWRNRDARGANLSLDALAAGLAKIEPSLYPPPSRLAMEYWYFRHKALTGVWFIYLAAFVILLPAFLLRNRAARRIGMLAFFAAFVLQTVSIGVRWYVARRIPTANMFEAVTAAAWSGAAIGLILEVWLRRRPMRNLFALGASFCGAVALMCGYFMPMLLSANISNPMPILNTVWLKIHVTLILISYVLIGVSFVTATLYLILRAATRLSGSRRLGEMWAGADAVAVRTTGRKDRSPEAGDVVAPYDLVVGGPPNVAAAVVPTRWSATAVTGCVLSVLGCLVLALLLRPEFARTASGITSVATAGAAIGRGLYILLLAVTVLAGPAFALWLLSGTARIIFGRDEVTAQGLRAPLATVLDGSTMLLIQLAFVTLWVGIILGAAWADVSWGRPWGWDPKEVFALNTWLIFVGLLHVRLNVRDKGLWTALLAVAGFAVMMFNWVGVNYFIVGLHSYA